MALGDGKAKKELNEINQEVAFLLDAVSSIGDKLVASLKRGEEGAEDISTILKRGIIKDTNQAVRNTEEFVKIQLKAEKGALKRSEIAKLQSKLEESQNQLAVKREVLKLQGSKVSNKILKTLEDQVAEQEKIFDKIDKSNTANGENVGLLDLATKAASSLADSIDKSGTLSKILNGELNNTQKFTLATQASFLLLVKGAFEASSNIANIAKNTGLSATAARDLQINFAFAAADSEKLFLTSKDLNKSFLELSSQTGLIADFGSQTLVTQSTLTKQLGLSAEQAGSLSLLSRLQSEDTEGVLDNTVNTVGALVKQSGVAVNVKSILEEISNTSAAITVSLGKNPEELAKAAVQAKLFGANLETVEGIASSLLNFEESIQNELEAELLIGKDINLEKARLLALNNDLAGLSAELAGQEEIINAFATGNRIQQEAAAKALGMSREELAKISLQQDYNNLSAETFKDTYGDITYQQLQSQSAGEKFASVLEKIQGVVGDIGIAFSPFLDGVAKLAGFFAASKVAAAALVGVLTTLAALSIASSIATIFQSFAKIPGGFGIPLAVASVAGMLATIGTGIAMATADDMVSTGYGDRILSTPKGSIALNNQDTVVAGTNLGGGNNESKRTNQLLERILTKQGTVSIDSTKAGTAFAMGTYQVQ